MTTIRRVSASDVSAISALFRQSVLTHAPAYYSRAQTLAWAAFAEETEPFRQFVLGAETFVAEDDTGIVGFAGLDIAGDEAGHVASVYVRCDRIRQGIGSALLQTLLDLAQRCGLPRLYAEASELSLGLFQKFGFCHYDTEIVERKGVEFRRYLVEREL